MQGSLHRLALRNIRLVAGFYLLVLIVMTHWPKLQIVTDGQPIDKLMHFIGFGLAACAVHVAQWCVRWWVLLLVMFGFTFLDEVTQATLSIGRVYSFADIVAGWLGVLVVVALAVAFRPMGGACSRLRGQQWLDGAASLLARPSPWMIIFMSGALGALVGGVILGTLDGYYPRPHPARAMLLGGLVGSLGLAHWTFEGGLRRELRLIRQQRRCAGCGAPQEAEGLSEDAMLSCPTCGRQNRVVDWEPQTTLSKGLLIHAIFRPLLTSGFCLLLLVVFWGVMVGFRNDPRVVDFDLWWRQMGYESQAVMDLTVGGLLAALTINGFRRRVAKAVDLQASRCLACGQDLHGLPTSGGFGRCPECGQWFSKIESDVCSPS